MAETEIKKTAKTETKAPPSVKPGAEAKEDVKTETQALEEILLVTAPAKGLRRAGRFWPGGVTEVSANELTPEQVAQLRAEPRLTVVKSRE